MSNDFYIPPLHRTHRAYIDLDKTLAYGTWEPGQVRSVIGDPIPENLIKLQELIDIGYTPYVHTSRHWGDFEMIQEWLEHYEIPIDPRHIIAGKPLGDIYVDDKAVSAYAQTWRLTKGEQHE